VTDYHGKASMAVQADIAETLVNQNAQAAGDVHKAKHISRTVRESEQLSTDLGLQCAQVLLLSPPGPSSRLTIR